MQNFGSTPPTGCYNDNDIGEGGVLIIIKYCKIAALLAIGFGSVSAMAETSSGKQKQARSYFNEHQAMQIAIKAQQKCGGLDTLTFTAAVITANVRNKALINMKSATVVRMAAARGSVQKSIDAADCNSLNANANLKIANDRAIFYKDFYLLVWAEYISFAQQRELFGSDITTFKCGKHSYNQIAAIKPMTDEAREAMKGKSQSANAIAQATKMIKSCLNNDPTVTTSPLMQMLEATQAQIAAKG